MCLQKWLNVRGNVDWAIWKIHSPALPYIWSTFLNPPTISISASFFVTILWFYNTLNVSLLFLVTFHHPTTLIIKCKDHLEIIWQIKSQKIVNIYNITMTYNMRLLTSIEEAQIRLCFAQLRSKQINAHPQVWPPGGHFSIRCKHCAKVEI